MNLEEHNLREIEGLSQRGRTLSLVDLIVANTLDVDMAAHSLYSMANGASFLTAARPGNAGKTTLMACLLTLLPPDVKIVTITDPRMLAEIHEDPRRGNADKLCLLCHEIGSGHWYGYLWGRYVGQLFHLMNGGHRIASCIHADTLAEMRSILISTELGVSEEDFDRLSLILFMKMERRPTGHRRRVAAFYQSTGDVGENGPLFTWDAGSDAFEQNTDLLPRGGASAQYEESLRQYPVELQQCRLFIESLMDSGETDFRRVRERVVDFFSRGGFLP